MKEAPLNCKPTILIFTRYFLPGFRAGGPIRSIANLVSVLNKSFNFYIVCFEMDHGSNRRYPNIMSGQWQERDGVMVRYVSIIELNFSFCKQIILDIKPDIIYLNSLFDSKFSIKPFLASKYGRFIPIVLAPRGELSSGALKIKPLRKYFFLKIVNAIKLYKNIFWHATSLTEIKMIEKHFSPDVDKVFLASNLSDAGQKSIGNRNRGKKVGKLRIVLAARISPVKNTLTAIRIASQLSGKVELDLIGLLEDKDYWGQCRRQIELASPRIKIRYVGEVEHSKLAKRLTSYDVMLMPSLGENFGHAIIEALDAGLPVVISNRTPWRNLKKAGVGFDLALEDERAFVSALSKYQLMSEDEMTLVRKACRIFVKKWRKSNNIQDVYKSMFNKVVASTKSAH